MGPVSYSNDELWKAQGPQTLRDACSFVRRVVELMSTNKTSVTRTVQQVLRKDAREALRKEGVLKLEFHSDSTKNTSLVITFVS